MIQKGKLIVFEGLDGSGKETQSNLMVECLQSLGVPHRKVDFPNYNSPSSSLIKMYLSGEFGKSAYAVNEYAAATFFAVDRFASYKTDWGNFYNQGGLIIADRYTTSNFIHQGSKMVNDLRLLADQERVMNYIRWIEDLEYRRMELPKPDQVIYLKVHPEISQNNILLRYNGDSEKMDIHEKDFEYLKRTHEVADYCADLLHWEIVPCSVIDQNGVPQMRSIDDIHTQIVEIIFGE